VFAGRVVLVEGSWRGVRWRNERGLAFVRVVVVRRRRKGRIREGRWLEGIVG